MKKNSQMCTNYAIVSSLENYMDDLMDCFEDFVRKSLLVVSVALGTIILMVMYILKVLAERAANSNTSYGTERTLESNDYQCRMTTALTEVDNEPEESKSETTIESDTETSPDTNRYKKAEEITSNYVLHTSDNTTSTSIQVASRPSFDEKVLREIGLSSCSKRCNTSKRTIVCNSSTRIQPTSPSPTCIDKHHLSDSRPCSKYIGIRTSCCSMCCVDDDRR